MKGYEIVSNVIILDKLKERLWCLHDDPIKAIREMVINAFAHAFYENHPEIEINIHPGLISIFYTGNEIYFVMISIKFSISLMSTLISSLVK